jgi:hypothetical protein
MSRPWLKSPLFTAMAHGESRAVEIQMVADQYILSSFTAIGASHYDHWCYHRCITLRPQVIYITQHRCRCWVARVPGSPLGLPTTATRSIHAVAGNGPVNAVAGCPPRRALTVGCLGKDLRGQKRHYGHTMAQSLENITRRTVKNTRLLQQDWTPGLDECQSPALVMRLAACSMLCLSAREAACGCCFVADLSSHT